MHYFKPDWPAPTNIRAVITLNEPDGSVFGANNLAVHVGDDVERVRRNRLRLAGEFKLPNWQWLTQVHGTRVLEVDASSLNEAPEADASTTAMHGVACAVLTADCLPVLLCNQQGTRVAAVHAGWRGLAAGILGEALGKFAKGDTLMAYLGPAIGPAAFEVGFEVKAAFLQLSSEAEVAFIPSTREGHFYADLCALARQQLEALGVEGVFGGGLCTFADERFYSYRRQNPTGRFASGIWID